MTKTEGSRTREQQAADQAAELIVFADAFEEAGWPALGRKARVVARDTIWLADMLAAERSARKALQQARDECLRILAEHAGQAAA